VKKILVPTDFSRNAADALAYAVDIVGSTKAELHILHIVLPDTGPPGMPAITESMAKRRIKFAQERVKSLADEYTPKNRPNISIHTKVIAGKTSPLIKKTAEEIEADLIISGTRGAGHDSMDKIFGTVSTAILDNAPCPVILVPQGYQYKFIDNIIFSTNLNHSDPYELWRAIEVIKPHQPTVRCVHVVDKEADKENIQIERFAKFMIEKSPAVETIFNIEVGEDIEDIIEKYAADYDAELIVMHREKKNLWTKIIGRSHTKRMVSTLQIPLMVIN